MMTPAHAVTAPARRMSWVPRDNGTWKMMTTMVLRMSTAATRAVGALVSCAIQSGTPTSARPNWMPKTALRAESAR